MRAPRRLFGRAAIILRLALLRTESENFSAFSPPPLPPPLHQPTVPAGAHVLGNIALPAPTAMTAARIVGQVGGCQYEKNQKKRQKKKKVVRS